MGTARNAQFQKATGGRGGSSARLPLVLVLVACQVGTSSDNAALSMATSSLASSLGASVADIQLASIVYSLAAGACMVAGGMVGVMVGWRRSLRFGLALVVAGELALAASPTMAVFTWAGRLTVGLGASLVTPSVLGLVPALWEGRDRVFAFGCISGGIAVSSFASIPLGMVLDAFGFRAAFFALGAYFLAVLAFTSALPAVGPTRRGLRFDVAGFVLTATGLSLFLLGVSRMSSWGVVAASSQAPFSVAGLSPSLPTVAAGIAVLAVCVRVEDRVDRERGFALLPRSFVRNPTVLSGLLAVMMPYFYMGAVMIVVTPYLQMVVGFSAVQCSLANLLLGVPMLLFAMFFPKAFPSASPRATVRAGYAFASASAALMAMGCGARDVGACFFAGLALAGAGLGMVNAQANNIVASAVDARDARQSGGVQGTARNIGTALGSAVLGTVLLVTVNVALPSALGAQGGVSPSVAAAMGERELSFAGDDAMREELAALPVEVDAGEGEAVLEENARVRLGAVRLSLGILAALSALALAGARAVPGRGGERGATRCGRFGS